MKKRTSKSERKPKAGKQKKASLRTQKNAQAESKSRPLQPEEKKRRNLKKSQPEPVAKKKNPRRVAAGKLAKEHADKSERDICKKLSIWRCAHADPDEDYYELRDDDIDGTRCIAKTFRRRLGFKKKGLGDVICEDEDFAFEIEIKSVERIDFYGLIQERKGRVDGKKPSEEKNDILRFWEQAKRQADNAGKYPMLIFNQHTLPHIVALPIHTAQEIFARNIVNVREIFALVSLERMLKHEYHMFCFGE